MEQAFSQCDRQDEEEEMLEAARELVAEAEPGTEGIVEVTHPSGHYKKFNYPVDFR